jgi:hypothetical protein
MRRLALRGLVLAAVIALLGVGSYAVAGDGTKNFQGNELNGYAENPDVSSVATGSFEARLSKDGTALEYELTYSGLEGTVTQSHIHFGKAGVNGGISLWLCQTATNPAPANSADTPTCLQEGTVTGVLDATDVSGPAGQGIAGATAVVPSEFAEILAAMRAGRTYANVHSSKFPGGEIRAQLNNNKG